MNTNEITQAIRGLSANSIGVYAADQIPSRLSHPAAIVANLDTSDKPGSHWVAFYIDSHGRGTFFDSYGLPPSSRHHLDRLRRNCKWIKWNKKKLQSFDSKVCGEYCVMFLHFMCSGFTLRKFCNIFTSDTRSNDKIVAKFYNIIKDKKFKKVGRTYNFPRATSRGHGSCTQACMPMTDYY